MISEEELAQIKQRCENALPGPWHTSEFMSENPLARTGAPVAILKALPPTRDNVIFDVCAQGTSGKYDPDVTRATAEFVANAPADIANLLNTIDELKKQLRVLPFYERMAEILVNWWKTPSGPSIARLASTPEWLALQEITLAHMALNYKGYRNGGWISDIDSIQPISTEELPGGDPYGFGV